MSTPREFENVVLIVVDALRYDKLGVNGSSLRTPNIDNFAKKYVNFDSAFACSNVTDVCVSTIMSGKYPLEHGILNQGADVTDEEKRYAESTTFLAEYLSKNGFHTAAVEPVLERWHQNGFDEFLPRRENNTVDEGLQAFIFNRIRPIGEYAFENLPSSITNQVPRYVRKAVNPPLNKYDAQWTTKTTLDLFDENMESNLFCFLHYWDTHTPYDVLNETTEELTSRRQYEDTPLNKKVAELGLEGSTTEQMMEEKISQEKPQTIADISSWYDFSVEYVDKWIGKLLDGMKKRQMLDNTLVILTSDHGESLTEHGILYDHHGLYDETIHVPLIMGGGKLPNRNILQLVQHYDITPTILQSVGIETESFIGGSLIDLIDGNSINGPPYDYVFAEEYHAQENRAIRSKHYKMIKNIGNSVCEYCDIKHSNGDQLFNLEEDPGEKSNLLRRDQNDYSDICDELVTAFSKWQGELQKPEKVNYDKSYNESQLEKKLEALGYK